MVEEYLFDSDYNSSPSSTGENEVQGKNQQKSLSQYNNFCAEFDENTTTDRNSVTKPSNNQLLRERALAWA